MKRISTTLFAVTLAFGGLAGQDEPEPKTVPSDKPLVQTEIEAESLRAEITEDKGYLIGVGNVKMTATNLQITCNQIEVFTDIKDKDGNESIGDISSINRIIATGNVRIVQDQRTATAGLAEVLPNEDFILLDKDPILYQGSITIDGTGAQLRIHRGNGRIEWVGDPNNKIHISAPPIKDLGFEENKDNIAPAQQEEIPKPKDETVPKDEPKEEASNDKNNRKRPNSN